MGQQLLINPAVFGTAMGTIRDNNEFINLVVFGTTMRTTWDNHLKIDKRFGLYWQHFGTTMVLDAQFASVVQRCVPWITLRRRYGDKPWFDAACREGFERKQAVYFH